MKKRYFTLALLGTCLSFITGCSSDEIVKSPDEETLPEKIPGEGTQEVQHITMTAEGFLTAPISRTMLDITTEPKSFEWSENDEVGIFPNQGGQVGFPMKDGAGTSSAKFDGGGWALKATSEYSAYYPLEHNFDLDKTAIPVKFSNQIYTPHKNPNKINLGKADYMTSQMTPTNTAGGVEFRFKHLGSLIGVNMTLKSTENLKAIKLTDGDGTADNGIFVHEGTFNLTQKKFDAENNPLALDITPTVTDDELIVQTQGITHEADKPFIVYFMMAPGATNGKFLTLSVKQGESTEFVNIGNLYIGADIKAGLYYQLNLKSYPSQQPDIEGWDSTNPELNGTATEDIY